MNPHAVIDVPFADVFAVYGRGQKLEAIVRHPSAQSVLKISTSVAGSGVP